MSSRPFLDRYFQLSEHNTTVRTEIIAGFVTFATMAYIIVVNPAILEAAGIPFGPSMVATIISAAFGTLLMGLYAKRPFAIAPYMGENAFVAYTVVGVLGYSWQTALGAVFVSGILFTILTLTGTRAAMSRAIPLNLKASFAAGIGLFITFVGLINANIIVLGVPGAPVHIGNLTDKSVLLAIFGTILIVFFLIRRTKGSLLLGILITAVIGFIIGVGQTPEAIVSTPPSITPILMQLDISGALTWGFFSVILTMFTMDFLDTIGSLIGVSARAGFLDDEGNLPDIGKPMLADALATMAASLLGTTTTGTFIESAAGVEEGGRTGLTAVVVGLLFLVGLFFAPLFSAIPMAATAPALIIVGAFMIAPISTIDWTDYTEVIPAFAVIVLMSFSFNIGVGLCGGFVLYPLCKIFAGKARTVHPAAWVLFALCLLFFIFYPY
ncbi:MAG: NCS2 family permease [Dehalococcoidia bacterium]|nr:NCS2 family permease [Dehalococcoidia bacterium]